MAVPLRVKSCGPPGWTGCSGLARAVAHYLSGVTRSVNAKCGRPPPSRGPPVKLCGRNASPCHGAGTLRDLATSVIAVQTSSAMGIPSRVRAARARLSGSPGTKTSAKPGAGGMAPGLDLARLDGRDVSRHVPDPVGVHTAAVGGHQGLGHAIRILLADPRGQENPAHEIVELRRRLDDHGCILRSVPRVAGRPFVRGGLPLHRLPFRGRCSGTWRNRITKPGCVVNDARQVCLHSRTG